MPEPARSRLEADRSATEERLQALDAAHDEMVAASRDTNADDEHDPEGTTIAFERAQLAALRRQAVDHLSEITAAIRRLDDGTYGACERCAHAIAPARLEARPTARTCVTCAARRPNGPAVS